MAQIKHTAGQLPPPACYSTEQERFEAYVAKIISTLVGGFQWENLSVAPVDLTLYWLRKDANDRHIGARKYHIPDARWAPFLESLCIPDASGGVADAYTATTGHNLVSSIIRRQFFRIAFEVAATNTGAATLNVDGTGALPIVRSNGAALVAGDLPADSVCIVSFNSTGGGRFELMSPPAPAAVAAPDVRGVVLQVVGPVPSAGAQTSIPHGISGKPFFVRVVLECTTNDAGYSVGDEVELINVRADQGSGGWFTAFGIASDGTNVYINRVTAPGASGTHIIKKDVVTATVAFTSANYQLRLYVI